MPKTGPKSTNLGDDASIGGADENDDLRERIMAAALRGRASLNATLLRMRRHDPAFTYAAAEVMLREGGSTTFLVAIPSARLHPELRAVDPVTRAPAPAGLWICASGRGERAEAFREWGIASAAENLVWLETCGVLLPFTSLTGIIE